MWCNKKITVKYFENYMYVSTSVEKIWKYVYFEKKIKTNNLK